MPAIAKELFASVPSGLSFNVLAVSDERQAS
jgi:hypothetical protein